MLPKNRRVPRRMFPLLSGGSRFENSLFSLKISKNPDRSSRFAFSVSKKVSKNAVVRNRCRRLGYRFLKENLPKIKDNILALFIFKKIPENNQDVLEKLNSILKISKIIK